MAQAQVAHCPERVLPGRILDEVVNNPRVIGGLSRRCAQRALALYRMVVRGDCRVTTARTAELAKLTENAYRDANTAREVNDAKPGFVLAKVRERAAALKRPVIACLGLAYKKDVDDLRESPAVEIVARLAEAKLGELLVVEPHIAALPPALAELGLELADFDAALERANLVLLLVDHQAFLQVDRDLLKDKFVIDTRGAW